MAKKVTISIPDMLHEKLEKWRESFNLSKMFQEIPKFYHKNFLYFSIEYFSKNRIYILVNTILSPH